MTPPRAPKRDTPTEASQASQASQDDVSPQPSQGGTGGTGGTGSQPPKGRAPRKAPLQLKLEELFAVPSMAYSFAGDEYAANLVASRAPLMAEAWYDLSKQNAGVKRILERITEGGAWGAVVFSTAAVLVPLAQHHGVLPGTDPFAPMLGGPVRPGPGPIVPPPPAPDGSNGTAPAGPENVGAAGDVFTPPVGDAPPGVVTVAGLRSMGADQAVTLD